MITEERMQEIKDAVERLTRLLQEEEKCRHAYKTEYHTYCTACGKDLHMDKDMTERIEEEGR